MKLTLAQLLEERKWLRERYVRRLVAERRSRFWKVGNKLLFDPAEGLDQCTQGLNFDTLRPREEILADLRDLGLFEDAGQLKAVG